MNSSEIPISSIQFCDPDPVTYPVLRRIHPAGIALCRYCLLNILIAILINLDRVLAWPGHYRHHTSVEPGTI
jgi:hypothetical protein